jgi:hypothetical protein
MAEEYQARAAALSAGLHGTGKGRPASARAPVQQQQQPQQGSVTGSQGTSTGSLMEQGQHWRERAEELRAQAALLEDGNARLLMLHMAESYEALARRPARFAWGSEE